ncbi:uncharacterized protein [Rutidosis leptorrhynchoides]|uniref:uncharacterized protein n=1 Tax=Rutidosis leptorrhynchoides TaxID=125765 RepID=UPI003A98EE4F
MMPPPRRKKWTEAEERTLIEKYGAMICDGSLSKMKTREKKYKPIALHVNSVHHHSDPVVYPWEWSWKDVSNKVQNMRHQYSLVKQKIKRPELGVVEGFQWVEGLTHWSNFLRYKEVFGDVTVPFGNGFDENDNGKQGNEEIVEFGDGSGGGEYENGVIGLEFDYDGGEREENYGNEDGNRVFKEIETMGSETRKKRKKAWGFVAKQLAQLREMEARFEQREDERERERQRRESVRVKNEEEREKQREKVMERLKEERRRRRDEERKWEERMIRRRTEWKGKIDEMLNEHRLEMGRIQSRTLHEQQILTTQLLGVVSQWSGHQSGIQDNTNGAYISQMMRSMQHVGVSGLVDVDAQVEEHNQDDQFIVDG